jgi:hypothetical protein
MPRYALEPLNASDIPRCASIQREAFREDELLLAALGDLSEEEEITSWFRSQLETDSTPPGYKKDVKIARDIETNEIAGWAKWWIPVDANDEDGNAERSPKVPPPSAIKHDIWRDFFAGIETIEKEIMGDRKHWGKS